MAAGATEGRLLCGEAGLVNLWCWQRPADGDVKPKHPFVPGIVTEDTAEGNLC